MGTLQRTSRLVAAGLAVVVLLLLAVTDAHSQPKRAENKSGFVIVKIKGRGRVNLNKGFVHPQTLNCSASCPPYVRLSFHQTRGPRAALTEEPGKGWKSAGWSGSCKSKRRIICAINLARVRPTQYGVRWANVTARFIR
jgi:hypothetical protein